MWIVVSVISFVILNLGLYCLGKYIMYGKGTHFKFWATGFFLLMSVVVLLSVIAGVLILIIEK
jgi:hypothetical protein